MIKNITFYILIFGAISVNYTKADDVAVLPIYQPIADKELIHGVLTSSGSTTLSPILKEWLKDFTSIYPSVTFTMSADGSGSAPKALLSGEANLGAMSRKIKDKEVAAFEALKFYKPYELKVALDALGIIVSRQNPVNSISLPQLDAIYSDTRLCGYPKPIIDWGDLSWNIPNKIEINHFDSNSGGHGLFRSMALCEGSYRENILPSHHTSLDMVHAVQASRFAIGLASMTVIDRSVKILKVGKSEKFPSILPNSSSISNGLYPFTRYLYLYLDKHPDSQLEPHLVEFIKYIYSRQGQKTALLKGSFPLSTVDIGKQLNILHKLN
jgi:phosphate transport system substrate-binding protein